MSRNVGAPYNIATTANDGLEIHLPAKYFYVVKSSENLNIQGFDRDQTQIVDFTNFPAGLGQGPFESLVVKWRIQTVSGNAGTITLVLCNDPTQYTALTLIGSITASLAGASALKATADKACANGAQTLVIAANAARRTVIVAPVAATATPMRFGDVNTAAGEGTPCSFGQSLALDTTDAVYCWNPNGAPINVSILELLT